MALPQEPKFTYKTLRKGISGGQAMNINKALWLTGKLPHRLRTKLI